MSGKNQDIGGSAALEHARNKSNGQYVTTGSESNGQDMELLNVKAVSELMSCSERTVHRLSDSGGMPAPLKIGRMIRWSRCSLMEWIQGGCQSVRAA